MMAKKILIINGDWGMGGISRIIKNTMENLANDWEKELLLLRSAKFAKRNQENERLFPFPRNTKVFTIEEDDVFIRFFALVRFLRDSRPHLICSHFLPGGNQLLLIYAAKKLAGLLSPIVAVHHGSYVFANYPFASILRHRGSFIDFPRNGRFDMFTLHLRKYIVKEKIEAIVTVCKDLEKLVRASWDISSDKIITIYHPIVGEEIFEYSQPEPSEYKNLHDSIKVVMVARLSTGSKDFQTLLRAFSLLTKKEKKAKLFLVGDGPGKDKIVQWIEDLNLKESVFLLGARPNPYPYIRYADVFTFASKFEGLGVVIVEAMALGCPVVATDCPVGPRELIGDNENGILVPMKDPEKMAEAMIRIMEDEELRIRIVENGKRKAQEFSISTSVRKYEELFKKLLERRGLNPQA